MEGELNIALQRWLLQTTGAGSVAAVAEVQSLWSGYGSILRCRLVEGAVPSVIVKQVRLSGAQGHPRGWHTSRSHARKERSYEVEQCFYWDWSGRCDDDCRVPACLGARRDGDEMVTLLEDLDAVGFAGRRQRVTDGEMRACLRWLANFHATYLGCEPAGLWPIGTYWHLATRPDELAALADEELRSGAAAIDARLNGARYRTLVHGDAKLANFCFGDDGAVAAVDFQYVGGGCGMKDVAYCISSCYGESECEAREAELLDWYFAELAAAMARRGIGGFVDLEAE